MQLCLISCKENVCKIYVACLLLEGRREREIVCFRRDTCESPPTAFHGGPDEPLTMD